MEVQIKIDSYLKFISSIDIVALATLNTLTDFSDAMIFAMLVPNMIGLFILSPKVAEELKRYRKLIKSNN